MKLPSVTYSLTEGVENLGPTTALYVGTATPEGVVAAAQGSMFIDVVGNLIYIKDTVSGKTGWATLTGGGGPVTWASIVGDPATSASLVARIDTQADTHVATHEAAANPHPIYLTQAEADALYDAIGAAVAAVATHEAAPNPHPVYLTQAEGDGFYDALGAAATAVAAHEAAGDPHPQYLTAAEGNAAYAPISSSGSQGRPGLDGADGEDGSPGAPGPAGASGATGIPGAAGQTVIWMAEDGNDGEAGPPGVSTPGTPGAAGRDGQVVIWMAEDGNDGEQGPQGIQGIQGPAGGGGGSAVEVDVDFGSRPQYDAKFTVTDAAVAASSKIFIAESGKTAAGRGASGDSQWDSIACAALPSAGSFVVHCRAIPGPVVGKRTLHYSVSA